MKRNLFKTKEGDLAIVFDNTIIVNTDKSVVSALIDEELISASSSKISVIELLSRIAHIKEFYIFKV